MGSFLIAKKLCSPGRLQNELKNIKTFCAYNGFPKWIVNRMVRRRDQLQTRTRDDRGIHTDNNVTTLYLSLPFCGVESEHIIKNTKRKLHRTFKEPQKVRYNVYLQTTKLSMYTSNKDKIPFLSNSHIIYHYTCPDVQNRM